MFDSSERSAVNRKELPVVLVLGLSFLNPLRFRTTLDTTLRTVLSEMSGWTPSKIKSMGAGTEGALLISSAPPEPI